MSDQEAAGLRARLVQAGIDLLTEEGVQALSLREIARRAGVSHGAPRRHFPTHLSLLSAIARQGFSDLADRVAAEIDDHPTDPAPSSWPWDAATSTSRWRTAACSS